MPEPRREDDLAHQRAAGKLPQFTVALTATLAAFSIGNYMSFLLDNRLDISLRYFTWVALVLPFGAMISALPTRIVADKIGRKRTILIAAIPLLICWFPIAFAEDQIWVCLARILAGFACGAASVIVPLYVSEIAADNMRSMLGIVFQVQVTLGMFFTHALAFTCDVFIVTILGILAPVLLLILYPTLPESPAWLIREGRQVEADYALKRLRGEGYRTEEEITRLERNYRTEGTRVNLFKLRSYRKETVIVAGLMLFQQPMSILATVYTSEIMLAEGMAFTSRNLVWVLAGLLQTIATVVCALLIDRTGKKILLYLSIAMMTVIMFTWCGYFYFLLYPSVREIPFIPEVIYCAFVVAYGIGFGPIPWMISGELFTGNMRSVACSVAALAHWFSAFFTYRVLSAIGHLVNVMVVFLVFAIIGMVGVVFVSAGVRTEKGKTTEQIQMELHESKRQDTRQPAITVTRTRT